MGKIAVVAGGNALLRGDQKGTIDEQRANAKETCEKLLLLIKSGYDIVLTHGNDRKLEILYCQILQVTRFTACPICQWMFVSLFARIYWVRSGATTEKYFKRKYR